jgi:hypothetical protein
MTIQNRWRLRDLQLLLLSSLALTVLVAVSGAEAAGLRNDDQRARQPAELKDARIGEDPDIIPQARSIGDDPRSAGSMVRLVASSVACIIMGLGEDPDPIPRIWWVSCGIIGDDPDSIPPTN